MPSPQVSSQTLGTSSVHDQPGSTPQNTEQPSPDTELPSSQASPASMTESPHEFTMKYLKLPVSQSGLSQLLAVVSMFTTLAVRDSGCDTKFTLSPALKPTCAGVPPRPPEPSDALPVVQLMSSYRNSTSKSPGSRSSRFVSTSWNVFDPGARARLK